MKKYQNLKKVELHCHLDGSLSPELATKWTRKPLGETKKALILQKRGNLEDYLNSFGYPISLLQNKARLKEATKELCNMMLEDSVVYAEIRFDPLSHTKKGLTIEEAVEGVLEAKNETSLKYNVILCMKRERSLEENLKIIDLAKSFISKGVVAVDLAGDENKYPTKDYKELFDYAKEKNVPFVIHAGEAGTFKDIDSAISFGAKRIGHGVEAIKSFETMESLKQNDIPLEISITSNIDTSKYKTYKEHPVLRLLDSGVSVTINTDNRTVSNTTLTDEYNTLNNTFGLTAREFNEMNKCAIKHAFLNDQEKEELLKNFN